MGWRTKYLNELEKTALRKSKLSKITTTVYGTRNMADFQERGWSIISHTPQNFASATNRYVMQIDRTVLEERLK